MDAGMWFAGGMLITIALDTCFGVLCTRKGWRRETEWLPVAWVYALLLMAWAFASSLIGPGWGVLAAPAIAAAMIAASTIYEVRKNKRAKAKYLARQMKP